MPQRASTSRRSAVPKNAVDSDKVVASLLADGLAPGRRRPRTPTSSSSTRARSSKRRVRSRSTSRSRSPTRSAPTRSSSSPAAWPSATATSSRRRCPKPTPSSASRARARLADVVLKRKPTGVRDLLELPRPAPSAPWAYVKIAEGCDRACAFCAIPSFRGHATITDARSRSRPRRARSSSKASSELVLVAQDLAWYGRDTGEPGALVPLLRRLDALAAAGLARIRLLYLYPSEVTDPLRRDDVRARRRSSRTSTSRCSTRRRRLLRRMKRWGSGDRFLTMIEQDPRRANPARRSARRSSSAFPGETEADHEQLLAFLDAARLDWAGFFPFSEEDGHRRGRCSTARSTTTLMRERLARVQRGPGPDHRGGTRRAGRRDGRGARRRRGDDGALVGRTYREAPEIDGIVRIVGRRRTTRARPCACASPASTAPTSRRAVTGGHDGRSAIAGGSGRARSPTPANLVTMLRLLVAVPTLLLIRDRGASWSRSRCGSRSPRPTASTAGSLAATARRARARSSIRSTDKLIVIGGLAVLADRGVVPVVAGASSSRSARSASRCTARSRAGAASCCPRSGSGKYKAFSQYCAVGFVLLPITADWQTFQHVVLYCCGRAHGRVRASRSSATAGSTGSAKTPEARPTS